MIIQRILDEFDTRRGLLEQITQMPMAFFQHACRNNVVDLLKACIRGMMPGETKGRPRMQFADETNNIKNWTRHPWEKSLIIPSLY